MNVASVGEIRHPLTVRPEHHLLSYQDQNNPGDYNNNNLTFF